MLGTTFVVAKEHALLAECRLLLVGKFVCSLDCIHLTWCWGLRMVCLDHNSPQCKRIRGTLAISQLDNEVLSCTSFWYFLVVCVSLIDNEVYFFVSAQKFAGGHELPVPFAGAISSRKAGVCLREPRMHRTSTQHHAVAGLTPVCTMPALRKRCFNIVCFGQNAARAAGWHVIHVLDVGWRCTIAKVWNNMK